MSHGRLSAGSHLPLLGHMLWFFYREEERLLYEIRRDADSIGYALVVRLPDGSERIERFENCTELLERSIELQRSLREEGWQPAHPAQQELGRTA